MPQIIEITSREQWLQLKSEDITSTEVAALFSEESDEGTYQTPFELFNNKKKGDVVSIEDNERMKWGRRLQDVIARGIAEDNGWQIKSLEGVYMRHDTVKGMGSSFDYAVYCPVRGWGILEIKNVDSLVFIKDWAKDGDAFEAPVKIELQIQHQFEVSDYNWGIIGVLVGGNRCILVERDRDKELGALICKKIKKFWDDVANDNPPAIDFVKDHELIKKLYSTVAGEAIITEDEYIYKLCADYKYYGEEAKIAEENKKRVKSELLILIDTAPKLFCKEFTISASEVNRKGYTVEPTIYRDFRINQKKA